VGVVAAKRPIHFEIEALDLTVADSPFENAVLYVRAKEGEGDYPLGLFILEALQDSGGHHLSLGRSKITIQSVEEGEP